MKRKIILPIVICLAVVASMAAVTYVARVDTEVDPVIGNTQTALLSFQRYDGTAYNYQFVKSKNAAAGANVYDVDLGQIQPRSNYVWGHLLKVTNNAQVAVCLSCVEVTPGGPTLTVVGDNIEFEVWAHEDVGGFSSFALLIDDEGTDAGPPTCKVLQPGKSCTISFECITGVYPGYPTLGMASATSLSGKLRFIAQTTGCPGACENTGGY